VDWFARQGICGIIVYALLVLDHVLQAHEFGEGLPLPLSVQPLISEMNQTLMICPNHELSELQLGSPLLYGEKDGKIFFLIDRQPSIPGS
jgi:hypothetical protein